MNEGFLLDEQLPTWWRSAIIRLEPHLQVWHIGDPGVPSLHSLDPVLLDWCEAHNYFLVTNNRTTMPVHLADHVAQGHHVPGIFVVNPMLDVKQLTEELSLIAGASLPDEYRDQIRHLPIT